jgi:hypothetical protein
VRRLDGLEQARHLAVREHHRKPGRAARAAHLAHPRQIEPEHLLVEEEQRRQRLLVRGQRHAALTREPGEKSLDLGRAHLGRVAQPVEAHERTHPMDIGLLGPYAVVQVADALAHLIEQPRGAQRREGTGALFHDRIVLYAYTAYAPPRQISSAFQHLPPRQIWEQLNALSVTPAPHITLGCTWRRRPSRCDEVC